MLHALRNASRKAREARDAGFTLIEILVAMVLMTIVMSSLAVFFIGAQKSTAALRIRENATVVADQAMDKVHSLDPTKLVTGRDTISANAQWSAALADVTLVGVDTTGMNFTSDPTAAAGDGTNPAKAQLLTVPVTVAANNTNYSVSTVVGTCWIPMGGGDCVKANPGGLSPVPMDRVVVAVNWVSKGSSCPNHTCAYVIASLISPTADPTFNVNQVLVDTTPPSTPSLGTCTTTGDQSIKINTWSASTDASGVARYDIYDGTQADFSTMGPKDGSVTTTGPYTDSGLIPNTTYYFVVVALDTVGNQSGPQVPVGTVTNPPQPFMISCTTAPDTFAPTAPTIIAGTTATTSTTNFNWTATPGTDDYKVGGYQIFRNGTLIQTVSATTTAYTDTGLSPWVTYHYTVKTVDKYLNLSNASNTLDIQTKDISPPSAPTWPVVGAIAAKPWPALEIDLAWNASTDDVGVTGYTVWRATSSGGPWTNIGTTTTATAWPDSAGLLGNTKYFYYVTAHDAVPNTSPSSTVVNASTPDTIPPSAPTWPATPPTKTSSTVTLIWNASTDNVGVTGYNIYRNGGTTPINTGAVTGTTYTDTGLTQYTSYSYTVRAYDAAGNVSAASSPVAVVTADGLPPSAPTVSTSAQTYTGVTLNWTTATDNVGVTSYSVFRNGVYVGATTSTVYTYNDSGLTPNTTYTYTVKAFDAAGNSTVSNSLAVKTAQDTAPPAKVTGVVGTSAAPNSVTISWGASSDNVALASYQIYVGGTLNKTVAAPALSYYYAAPQLASNSSYSVTVYAVDTSGNQSPVSATLTCVVNNSGNVTCS